MGMIMQWDEVEAADLARVVALDDDELFDWLEEGDDRAVFDIDKAWHGVHFVLTGDAWETTGPLGAAVLGGTEFGEDNGYGPSRYLDPGEVAALARDLEALVPETFVERIDLAALAANDIYPGGWDDEADQEDLVEYLRAGYVAVRDGYLSAAASGRAMIISLL
jgi:hypothetical protein